MPLSQSCVTHRATCTFLRYVCSGHNTFFVSDTSYSFDLWPRWTPCSSNKCNLARMIAYLPWFIVTTRVFPRSNIDKPNYVNQVSGDVVLLWNFTEGGEWSVSTCSEHTDFDTYLSLYDGSDLELTDVRLRWLSKSSLVRVKGVFRGIGTILAYYKSLSDLSPLASVGSFYPLPSSRALRPTWACTTGAIRSSRVCVCIDAWIMWSWKNWGVEVSCAMLANPNSPEITFERFSHN